MIYVFTKYSKQGASSRVRFFKYLKFIRDKDFVHTSLFDDKYLENIYNKSNVSFFSLFLYYFKRAINVLLVCFNRKVKIVWIEKELFPYFPLPIEIIFSLFGKKVIYDYDDAVFHNYDKFWFLFKYKFKVIAVWSDVILSGNDYISAFFSKLGAKRVEYIPTVVDVQAYDIQVMSDRNDSTVVIGWIGTPNTQKYLAILDNVFLDLKNKYKNIEITLIGANENAPISCDFNIVPWAEDSEIESLKMFDIGIMPLVNSNFEKGKCGYKLIQYSACHLPVIGSPVGVNKKIIQNGFNGFLSDSESEWFENLEKLIVSPELRKEMGYSGYCKVRDQYSYQITSIKISNILDSLINSK